jgi:outer membrane protein assembly factor BamB
MMIRIQSWFPFQQLNIFCFTYNFFERMPMGKRKWLLVIVISLVLFQYCAVAASSGNITSVSDEWTMFRHNPNRNGYVTGNIVPASFKLLWTSETWKGVMSSPAVANGCVVVGANDWRIYRLDLSKGAPVWNISTGNEVHSSPAIYNNSIYVGSDDGYVYSIDLATGTVLWKKEVGGFVRSSPAISDGCVYIGSGNHDVFCLNASDGAEIWRCPTAQRVHSSPAVSDGVIYVATDDFYLYAINASTGKELWRTHTGSVISSPCVYDGSVYIGSTDGYIDGINASTGKVTWTYLTGGSVSSSPAVAYGCVYIGSDDNKIYCLNATNGEKVWHYSTGYWVRSSPTVADGNVYVGSEDYNIYCLDAFTGEKKWSYETENFVDSSPTIVNSCLYFGSSDRHVYAFALSDSPADSPPSQSNNSLPWTIVVFDVIACAVAAAITFTVVRFFYVTMLSKQNVQAVKTMPWLSRHIDFLCIVAILAFSALFFVNLGSGPLWVADEQTYSQWTFHMFKDGDYMTPWAFGDVLMWIGKPPLFMWLMSLAYQMFGVTNFAARFWSATFGTLSLVTIFYLGKKLYNVHVGLISAFVLGTFTTFYVFARHAMLDVSFIFFMLASIYFLLLSEKTEKPTRYVALGGLFFGLAFMIKQVAAFLIPIIIFAYFVTTRKGIRFLFTKRFSLFWRVSILIVAPWMIYMTLRFGPDFWDSFFVFSGLMRASTPIEGHVGSYLFYFNYLTNNENAVWMILLPFSAGLCAFNAVAKRLKEDTLILAWMTIVLVLFSLIQTKLEWYILPAFPAFAIAISSLLYQTAKKARLAINYYYPYVNRVAGHVSPKTKNVLEKAKTKVQRLLITKNY